MDATLSRAGLLILSLLISACGADTRPLWYTRAEVFSAPIPDAQGNIRALKTYGTVRNTLLSPNGEILTNTLIDPFGPDYETVHAGSDPEGNAYAYGLRTTGFLSQTPAWMTLRAWGPDNGLRFDKEIPLDLPDGIRISRTRYTDAGPGIRLISLHLQRYGLGTLVSDTLFLLVDGGGNVTGQRLVPGRAEVVVASAKVGLVYQNRRLTALALPDLAEVQNWSPEMLDAGNDDSLIRATTDSQGRFKLVIAQSDRDTTTYQRLNERVALVTVSADGRSLTQTPWPDQQSGTVDTLDAGWPRQFPLQRLVSLPDGGLVAVEQCEGGDGCPASGRYLLATTAEGVEQWRRPVVLPATLPLVMSLNQGSTFLRLPQQTEVLYSMTSLSVRHGRVWLMNNSFSRGTLPESAQSLNELWTLDPATGVGQRRVSTFRQIIDYTVTANDELYVSHRGFSDGITPSGIARYR